MNNLFIYEAVGDADVVKSGADLLIIGSTNFIKRYINPPTNTNTPITIPAIAPELYSLLLDGGAGCGILLASALLLIATFVLLNWVFNSLTSF